MARRIAEVAVAVLLGAGLVGLGVTLFGSDTTDEPAMTTTTTRRTNKPEDPGQFLEAFERSLSGTYLTRGTFTAYRDDALVETLTYKRVRQGGQLFEQEGDSILKIDGSEQQLCFQQLDQSDVLCGEPTPSSSVAEALQPVHERVTIQQGEATPDYVIRAEPDDCWLVTSTRPLPFEDWGQSSTWCFDPATGALVFQEIVNGTRVTVRQATLTVGDVTIDDFAPDRG